MLENIKNAISFQQPEVSEAFGILIPFLADLDEQEEMHFPAAKKLRKFLAGRLAYLLDRLTALADDDLLLRFTQNVNGLLDADGTIRTFLPQFRLHVRGIGQLVVQAQIELLAGDLRSQHAQGKIRKLIRGIEPRSCRHPRRQIVPQIGHAIALQGRHHEGGLEGKFRVEPIGQLQKPALLDQIHLVENEDGLAPRFFQACQNPLVLLVQTATGIHLLDLSVRLLGRAESVLCICEQLSSELPQGDTVAAYVKFAGGGTSYVSASLSNPFMSRFTVYGSKGWIDIRDKAHVEAPDGWIVTSAMAGGPIETVEIGKAEPVKDNLVSFARAVRGQETYPITADHLVDNIALLEAVFASSRSGQIERVAQPAAAKVGA